MIYKTQLIAFLIFLISFSPAMPLAYAGGNSQNSSLVTFNQRTFDLRADASLKKLGRTDTFIPLTRIEWLWNLIKKDKYLAPTVIHIRVKSQPVSIIWPSVIPDERYPITKNIPETYLLDGYQTRSRHPSNRGLVIMPTDDPRDFFVTCEGVDITINASCFVKASYPPDPKIFLLARIYNAKPPFNFREIAHRMREIAYCLDVTDEIKQEKYKAETFVDADGDLPTLVNCN